MDRETAERITKLEMKMDAVEKEQTLWNSILKDTILKIVKLLIGIAMTGLLFGWHLPENVRKTIAEWISK